ncbi:MAG: lipoyl(octanoyl) transferase LipB [Desulfobacterales bacterium]
MKTTSARSGLTEAPDVFAAGINSKSEIQHSASTTRNPKYATRNSPLATRNPQPVTRNTQHDPCYSVNLGMIDYNKAWQLQSELVAAKANSSIDRDIILFLEHPAVFTLGRRGGRDYLLVGESFLEQSGVPVVQVERGGYITFHGPGQLVVYTLIDLEARRLGVTDFVAALEEIMLQSVRAWGLTAQRSNANPGIWIGRRKMGSIGIALRKGISFHGLALNVNLDLTPFSWIQPCGLEGVSMTSVKQELGKEIPMRVVRHTVKKNFQSVLGLDLNDISYPDLQQQLLTG